MSEIPMQAVQLTGYLEDHLYFGLSYQRGSTVVEPDRVFGRPPTIVVIWDLTGKVFGGTDTDGQVALPGSFYT